MTPANRQHDIRVSHHNRGPEPSVFDEVLAAMEHEVTRGNPSFVAATAESGDDIDSRRFREVLSWFPTGVTVVTSLAAGEPVGMTVGSFCSLSLRPAQVLFCATSTSRSWQRIKAAERFCVNVLAHDQVKVCEAFARPGDDRFAGLAWNVTGRGLPVLGDVVAYIDCDLVTVAASGDHDVAIGHVRDLQVCRREQPLVFFRGGWGVRAPASDA